MAARMTGTLRTARTCYRHPAGQLGVALTDWLRARGWVVPADGGYRLTADGRARLAALGVPADRLDTRRVYKACTDHTERRDHLGGDLGAALTAWLFAQGWVARPPEGGRGLLLGSKGRAALADLGVALSAPRSASS